MGQIKLYYRRQHLDLVEFITPHAITPHALEGSGSTQPKQQFLHTCPEKQGQIKYINGPDKLHLQKMNHRKGELWKAHHLESTCFSSGILSNRWGAHLLSKEQADNEELHEAAYLYSQATESERNPPK